MVVIQNTTDDAPVDESNLMNILQNVLENSNQSESELLVRLVEKTEIQALNSAYRNQQRPTNVLSFPSDLPIEINQAILGDVVICTEVVADEAKAQHKTFENHLIHMAIHGTLHLLGYDHIDSKQAQVMEALEVKILQTLDIANPYK